MRERVDQAKALFISPQFLRFFVIGFGVFIVDFTILNTLVYLVDFDVFVLGIISLANVVSTTVGLILTFILNRYWTFGIKGRSRMGSQSMKFLGTAIVVWVLHQIAFGSLVQLGVIHPVSKIIVMAVQMVVNFLLYKFVVFTD
jgi:putative flippase GtrA